MKIDDTVFYEKKIKLHNLNYGETFLYKDEIFMKSIGYNKDPRIDNIECSNLEWSFVVNLRSGYSEWLSSDINVEPIKTKLTLDK